MRRLYLLILTTFPLIRCNVSEFSPDQKFNSKSATHVNATNIAKLPHKTAGAKIRIAVSGDTQRGYNEAADFVSYINSRNDIDFVFLNGDISDFGLLKEFGDINAIYSKLKVPYISIIGNHDLVANGSEIYERMFGDKNFTFNYAGVKFVCHDTNSREYNFNGTVPDMNWLRNNLTLDSGTNYIVGMSHVPPDDQDFDPELRSAYEQLFNHTPGVIASVHAHQHSPQVIYRVDGGIPFIVVNAVLNRAFTIIEIENGEINVQAIDF